MEAWNHESMEARKHGNMHGGEAWNDKESHLYRWNLAIIFTYGIMESWKYWSIEAWKLWSMEVWKHGNKKAWKHWSWSHWSMEVLKHGSLKLSWSSLEGLFHEALFLWKKKSYEHFSQVFEDNEFLLIGWCWNINSFIFSFLITVWQSDYNREVVL